MASRHPPITYPCVPPPPSLQLIISYHMDAASMCEFSKEEFTGGMVKMACDSMDKLKKRLPELRAELKHDDKFREIYNYAYMFSREVRRGGGQEGPICGGRVSSVFARCVNLVEPCGGGSALLTPSTAPHSNQRSVVFSACP